MTQKEAFELVDHQLLMQMDSAVREAWQTLKSIVLAAQPNNARDEILRDCETCNYDSTGHPNCASCTSFSNWQCKASPVSYVACNFGISGIVGGGMTPEISKQLGW